MVKVTSWMSPQTHQAEILKYGIEVGGKAPYIGCGCSGNYQVFWAEWYDMELIKKLLVPSNNNEPATIMNGFRAYFDSGSEEIMLYARMVEQYSEQENKMVHIRESNYELYINQINDWYLTRTGKYDPEPEELT
jgi:hypothetical protein